MFQCCFLSCFLMFFLIIGLVLFIRKNVHAVKLDNLMFYYFPPGKICTPWKAKCLRLALMNILFVANKQFSITNLPNNNSTIQFLVKIQTTIMYTKKTIQYKQPTFRTRIKLKLQKQTIQYLLVITNLTTILNIPSSTLLSCNTKNSVQL